MGLNEDMKCQQRKTRIKYKGRKKEIERINNNKYSNHEYEKILEK